jgi:hypothetical protein
MTAWPRLMPPSLQGTRECTSTRNPRASRWLTVRCRSSRFWNTPSDKATVPRPFRSRSSAQPSSTQREARPASRAAGRLRAEAPVGGVVVLGGAPLAHAKRGHGRERPVVGDILDDGEPGTAVSAVDKRVPVPPVGRVGELAQAVRAGIGVRGDQGPARTRGVSGIRVAGPPVAGWPSTSANTPPTSLPTSPPSPRRVASAYTKGRSRRPGRYPPLGRPS